MDPFLDYSVIWQDCRDRNEYAKRFFVPEFRGYLPFFIDGDDLSKSKAASPIELNEQQLLKGILYGLNPSEDSKLPMNRPDDQKTYLYLLDVLYKGFNYSSLEQMILDISSNVRTTNGNLPSSIMLRTGNKLIPSSSKIMSDLICDLWKLSVGINEKYLIDILHYFKGIQFKDIMPEAREAVAYFGFSALRILDKSDEFNIFLEKYIYPNVTNRQLKNKVKYMLEYTGKLKPIDLDF